MRSHPLVLGKVISDSRYLAGLSWGGFLQVAEGRSAADTGPGGMELTTASNSTETTPCMDINPHCQHV